MEAKVLQAEENYVMLELDGFKVPLVNAFRRAILNSVNTLAIDDVTIFKNTSSMYDEVLASRLGLLPLKADPDISKKKQITFKLKETGPKTVYASDMKSEDPDVKPVYDNTIIMQLADQERIELEATAVFGNGQEHAKFAPGHVYYHFYPVIKTTDKTVKGSKIIAAQCPVDILDGSDNKIAVKKGQTAKCILCKACEDYAGKDTISISSDSDKIVFELESWGQLPAKDIMLQAVDSLQDELKEIASDVK